MVVNKPAVDWLVSPPDGTGLPDSIKKYRDRPYQEYCSVHAVDEDGKCVQAVCHVYQGWNDEVGSPAALAVQTENAYLIAAAYQMRNTLTLTETAVSDAIIALSRPLPDLAEIILSLRRVTEAARATKASAQPPVIHAPPT